MTKKKRMHLTTQPEAPAPEQPQAEEAQQPVAEQAPAMPPPGMSMNNEVQRMFGQLVWQITEQQTQIAVLQSQLGQARTLLQAVSAQVAAQK